ncbi:MAG: hypothetical protein AB8G05_11450 [Oligoflexales bacterium]
MRKSCLLFKIRFTSILACILCLLQTSCDQGNQSQPERVRLDNGTPTEGPGLDKDRNSETESNQVEEKVVKFDASELFVTGLRVVKKREQLSLAHNLSFEADGRAEYVDYRICPLEDVGKECTEGFECARGGNCVQGITPHNRLKLPLLYAGKVLFKARACADRKNTLTDDICGGWQEKEYDSQVYNIRIATLTGRAIDLKKDLGILNKDYKDALETFVQDARECDAINAEVQKVLDSKVRIVEDFVRAPIEHFVMAGEFAADQVLWGQTDQVVGGLEKAGSTISEGLERECLRIGEATADWVCSVLKIPGQFAKGMLAAMSPVTAIGTVSNSVHDIYYGTFLGQGDKLVPKACLAEQKLQRSADIIELQMEKKLDELRGIKVQLENAGESTVIPNEEE